MTLSVLGFISFPILAGIAGATLAAFKPPNPRLASAIQHFAAGVVFAAVAGEILPSITGTHNEAMLVLGFAAGVGLMLAINAWERKNEEFDGKGDGLPLGAILAVGVDLLIDGVLIGIAFVAGERQGLLLTFALTLEILFLGLSTASLLAKAQATPAKTILIVSGLSLLTGVGAVASVAAGPALSSGALTFVLAFGCAALLYLVTEELLVEAHENAPDSSWRTSMFFVGFLLVILL